MAPTQTDRQTGGQTDRQTDRDRQIPRRCVHVLGAPLWDYLSSRLLSFPQLQLEGKPHLSHHLHRLLLFVPRTLPWLQSAAGRGLPLQLERPAPRHFPPLLAIYLGHRVNTVLLHTAGRGEGRGGEGEWEGEWKE